MRAHDTAIIRIDGETKTLWDDSNALMASGELSLCNVATPAKGGQACGAASKAAMLAARR